MVMAGLVTTVALFPVRLVLMVVVMVVVVVVMAVVMLVCLLLLPLQANV
jgi:hypothetical protein